jgi:C4-dicarboxylate transporter DctM subunit
MILLTVPVFFPLVVSMGFDPVWFGIIIVAVVEIGLISPPVGMNMFVVRSLLSQISSATIFCGVRPFAIADVVWHPGGILGDPPVPALAPQALRAMLGRMAPGAILSLLDCAGSFGINA